LLTSSEVCMITLKTVISSKLKPEQNKFECFMKPRETRILLLSRLESESNIFESLMSILLKIVFPSKHFYKETIVLIYYFITI